MFKKGESPDDADWTFNNRHHPNIIQGLNRKYNSRHRSSWSRDWYFPPTLRKPFYKRWLIIFFYGSGCSFVRCCRKNLQCRLARIFRSSSTEVVFRPTPPGFHLLGKENICPPWKKNYSPVLIEKNPSRHRQRKFTNRGLKKNHLVTPIEHFEIDIIQILFRDWIDKTTANISREIAATAIFQPTLRRLFYKRWPIIFFYGRGCSFVRCCRKNLQCRSARFFRSSSTEVVFRPTPACFHLLV